MQCAKKLAWSIFYGNLELSELDKIQTINELLCSKYMDWYLRRGLMFLRLILS